MIEFPKYVQIKDKYCICYFGQSKEYLIQLNLLKPLIEKKYPNLEFYIGCKDELIDLLPKDNFFLKFSELRNRRLDFGHIREISFDGKNHPIEQLIEESGLENCVICHKNQEEKTSRCVILTKGSYPTIQLNELQINKLVRMAKNEGFEPEIDHPIDFSGLVMGVESFELFEAASKGIQTKLIPTGLGTKLYQKMFPQGEILNI